MSLHKVENEVSDEDGDSFCPTLPPHLTSSEPKVQVNSNSEQDSAEESDDDLFCPALPPHLLNKSKQSASSTREKVVGPSLPANYVPPPMPDEPHSDSCPSDGEDFIGPVPCSEVDPHYRIREIERRAAKMKDALTNKDDKPLVRESWMLELPDDKPNLLSLGLAPRKFARNTPQEKGDRSVWTDLPADKQRKLSKDEKNKKEESIDVVASKKRDQELSVLVDDYNAQKRGKSLVEMHQNKKPKKESGEPSIRRPFTREDDLNVNKFDEAQRATIMQKAALLNDRFSAGKRKFL